MDTIPSNATDDVLEVILKNRLFRGANIKTQDTGSLKDTLEVY